jgi:quercetin dioxygenase-like cupin family protein
MDRSQLKNDKYFLGQYIGANDYKGWFVGSFFKEGHPGKTDKIEILYKEHVPGDIEKPHYHQEKVELIIMLEGKAKYQINDNEVLLEKENFLFIDVNNVIQGEFLESSKIFVIHSPSIPTDKTLVDG